MTDWITQLIEQMGYFGITLLMFLEYLSRRYHPR